MAGYTVTTIAIVTDFDELDVVALEQLPLPDNALIQLEMHLASVPTVDCINTLVDKLTNAGISTWQDAGGYSVIALGGTQSDPTLYVNIVKPAQWKSLVGVFTGLSLITTIINWVVGNVPGVSTIMTGINDVIGIVMIVVMMMVIMPMLSDNKSGGLLGGLF